MTTKKKKVAPQPVLKNTKDSKKERDPKRDEWFDNRFKEMRDDN